MKRIIITSAAVAMLAAVNVQAQDNAESIFDNYLTDNTLRIDYIFAGDATSQEIYLDEMSASEGWAGRRVNMDKVPVAGNGCITLRDSASSRSSTGRPSRLCSRSGRLRRRLPESENPSRMSISFQCRRRPPLSPWSCSATGA